MEAQVIHYIEKYEGKIETNQNTRKGHSRCFMTIKLPH